MGIFRKKGFRILISLIIIGVLLGGLYMLNMKRNIEAVASATYEELIQEATKGNKNGVLTIGYISNGKTEWKVYGEDGKELEKKRHKYEIGSISKTFLGNLTARYVDEGVIGLDEEIGEILFPGEFQKGTTPTIKDLVTHTAGFRTYYLNRVMLSKMLTSRNAFTDVTKEMMLKEARKHMPQKGEHAFKYSNFGISLVGLALEKKTGRPFNELITEYIQNDLGLGSTVIGDGTGDFSDYWVWKPDDAYLPAGGIASDIEDMLLYLKMNMEKTRKEFSRAQTQLKKINGSNFIYDTVGIGLNGMGITWVMDEKKGYYWHNGGTDFFNTYMAFDREGNNGVVVLFNQSANKGVNSTFIGSKLMDRLTGK